MWKWFSHLPFLQVSRDGRFGLYAPARGGLELLELRHGTSVRTLIPRVAEGVFSVICLFTRTDEYVLYYHGGRKTIRVFRFVVNTLRFLPSELTRSL